MNERAEQLQFLRFLGFLLVFAHHMRGYEISWSPGEPGACNAVVFFFVLGGFLSGFSSYGKTIHFSFGLEREYLLKKLRSYYPLYFVTTVFALIYSPIPRCLMQHDYRDFMPAIKLLARCLLLIQSWFPADFFSFNAVGWFLSTLFFLYIINIPLRAVFSKIMELKHSSVILAVIAAAFCIIICLYCYATRNTNILYTQYVLPISRTGEYICGMALGYLAYPFVQRVKPAGKNAFLIFTVLEAAALFFWIYHIYTPHQLWTTRIVNWLLPNCILIVVFVFGKGLLSRIFRYKWLVYLGNLTFECFIIHVVLIRMVVYTQMVMIGADPSNSLAKAFLVSFTLIMTILIAASISREKVPTAKT